MTAGDARRECYGIPLSRPEFTYLFEAGECNRIAATQTKVRILGCVLQFFFAVAEGLGYRAPVLFSGSPGCQTVYILNTPVDRLGIHGKNHCW